MALLEDGQSNEAAATFDRLLQVAPRSPEGYYGRARVFAARGDGDKAGAALKAAAALVEPDARARLAEQGIKGEAAVRAATERSLAAMRSDPAFARWSNTASWPMLSDAGAR
jgi:thioredoxin-like negative regulator of GroEL